MYLNWKFRLIRKIENYTLVHDSQKASNFMSFVYNANLIFVIYFSVPLLRFSAINLFWVVESASGLEQFIFQGVKNPTVNELIILYMNFGMSVLIGIVQVFLIFYFYYNLDVNAPLLNPFNIKQDTIFHSNKCPDYCSGIYINKLYILLSVNIIINII